MDQTVCMQKKMGPGGPMNFGNINAWASVSKSVQLGKKNVIYT